MERGVADAVVEAVGRDDGVLRAVGVALKHCPPRHQELTPHMGAAASLGMTAAPNCGA